MQNHNISLSRKILYYILFATILGAITLLIGEGVVRVAKYFGPSTFPFRQFDPQLGVSLIPNSKGIHRRCYDGFVNINSVGMRDKERELEKPADSYRVAIFSDSLLEAVHVKPEETATILLEQQLNQGPCSGNCEVLNFSVGGYATLQYYLRYMRDARKFNNDLVIVMMTDNDLPVLLDDGNNLGDTAGENYHAVGSLYPSPYLKKHGVSYEIVYPQAPALSNSMLSLFRYSDLAYFFYKFYNIFIKAPLEWPIKEAAPTWAKFQPGYLFLDPENPIADRGWEETDYILSMFINQVKQDGAEFILAHWGYDVDSNPWYKAVPDNAELPESFDPTYASKWFAQFGQRHAIDVVNLNTGLTSYIKEHDLGEPYLSFTCDSHFNPEGQRVIADLLLPAVKKRFE